MKRILGIIAVSGMLTAAPAAFAEVDVFFNFGTPAPAPVYVAPAQPVYYRNAEPRWHERREYFERHEFRHHHHGDFRHHYHDRY